ncbi:MAG: Fur family transcriptional regulator [Candidatus Thorarchaeota archaeon]
MDGQELFALFRKNGYKVTPQRLAIYKFISTRKDHPTADQIYQELKTDYPTLSLGTIYKTLHTLKELGLIQELGFDIGRIRYDPDMELHINLICAKCGKITDYKDENLNKVWNSVIKNLDIEPSGQRIDLYYTCDDCN